MNSHSYIFIILCLPLLFFMCRQDTVDPEHSRTDFEDAAIDSMSILDRLVEQSAEDSEPYFRRASFFYRHQFYGQAISDLETCLNLDPESVDCIHLLSDAYLDNNESRRAIETLENYLIEHPNHVPTLKKMISLQIIVQRYQAAHLHINRILNIDANDDRALFLKGLAYRDEGKTLEAVEFLQRAIQSNPDLTEGHLLLGQIFEEAGNPMAQQYYENVLRIEPEHEEGGLGLANYLWLHDHTGAALFQFKNLLKSHPEFIKAHFNLGLLYLELDSIPQAIHVMQKVVELDSTFVKGHEYLSEAYAQGGQMEQAIRHLQRALTLSPNDQAIRRKLTEWQDATN